MTYTNEQLKKAFFALLHDSKINVGQASEYDTCNDYCARYCPVAEGFEDNFRCPAQIREELLKFYATGD